jgi:outer membrane biosynthesis protein TonB
MSLRPGRYDHKRLWWALVISLAFHLMCFGGYEFTRKVLPGWLERIKFLAALAHQLEEKKKAPPTPPSEAPLMFVEVNPAVATPEPPKDAKFYSSQNSKAANPDTEADKDMPKIDGTQEHVPKAEDAPRKFVPLQPSPAPASQEQNEERAKPKPPVGDLAMAKPDPELKPDIGKAEKTRPRTVVEAKMRQPQNQLQGQKSKQEGGVRHHLEISAFDAKATPFGEYDRAFIDAVQTRWNDLLDSQQFALNRTGKVVLQFRLNYDGRISDMQIAETTVGETLAYVCQLAVTDPAPYMKWPSDMRREIGDSRYIQFTFFY